MHDWDLSEPRCTSENFISDCKSVDALVVLEKKHLLLSMTADQWLRFWDLDDMQSPKPPIWKMHADHMSPAINPELEVVNPKYGMKQFSVAEDQLTGVAVTMENDRFVTVDTSGRIKMHNIRDMDFRTGTPSEIEAGIGNPWFIRAHRKMINSVEMVEQKNEEDIESSESGEEIELPEGLEKEER